MSKEQDAYIALTAILIKALGTALSKPIKIGVCEYKVEVLQVTSSALSGRVTGPLAGSTYFYNFDITPESYGLSSEVGGIPHHRTVKGRMG